MLIYGVVDLPLWLPMLVFLGVLLYIYGSYPLQTWKKLGVPGPKPVPFFGNVNELYEAKAGICANIRRWQGQYGRIFGLYFFRSQILMVTDMEALRQVFVKEFNNFSDRFMAGAGTLQQPIIKKGVFFEDGTDWRRIRRIMTPTFSSGKLRLLIHHINRTAEQLANNLAISSLQGSYPEAKKVFGAFSLDVIAGTAFGLDLDSQNNLNSPFMTHVKSLITSDRSARIKVAIASIFPMVGMLLRQFNIGLFNSNDVAYFQKQMYSLIQERKAHPEHFKQVDFIQLLMNAEADASEEIVGSKKLTRDEVAAQGIVFIIAGYETSSTTLQYLTYELARHADVQAKLVAEVKEVVGEDQHPSYEHCQRLKYMEAVINETLRMYPPLHLLTRQALHPTTLKGIPVPAKTAIYIPLFNIGRDPEYFENPDTFTPDRFIGENKQKMDSVSFLPFGFGPRQCIGMRMAMLQLKIALVHVLRKIEIVDAIPKQLEIEDYSGVLIPKKPVQLILKKRID